MASSSVFIVSALLLICVLYSATDAEAGPPGSEPFTSTRVDEIFEDYKVPDNIAGTLFFFAVLYEYNFEEGTHGGDAKKDEVCTAYANSAEEEATLSGYDKTEFDCDTNFKVLDILAHEDTGEIIVVATFDTGTEDGFSEQAVRTVVVQAFEIGSSLDTQFGFVTDPNSGIIFYDLSGKKSEDEDEKTESNLSAGAIAGISLAVPTSFAAVGFLLLNHFQSELTSRILNKVTGLFAKCFGCAKEKPKEEEGKTTDISSQVKALVDESLREHAEAKEKTKDVATEEENEKGEP